MDDRNLFREYEGTSVDVRAARQMVKDSLAKVVHDVREIPELAKSGLRRDWHETSEKLSAASVIRRYPAAAVALAIAGGFLAGKRLLDLRSPGGAAKVFASTRPLHRGKASGLFDQLRRTFGNNVVNDDTIFRARGMALSLAGQLATAAISRIIAEHKQRSSQQPHNFQ